MKRRIITLLTDFGSVEHYAAAMKGVLLGICPEAQLIDISHEIPPYGIADAAFTLAQAWKCFPEGTVHLIVVDPGVGSSRRPIVVEAAGHCFVAPDNGVLTMLYDAIPVHEVREITAAHYFRQPVSRTFHGRDIFAPVAAHVAKGVRPEAFGTSIGDYRQLGFSKPSRTGEKTWAGTVLKIDRFGNVITNFDSEIWLRPGADLFQIRAGSRLIARIASNYAEMPPGEPFVIAGSAGYLELSLNQGSAAAAIGARSGDSLELRTES
jgi:S-adenosyl-L-methionine hydrolase (adenosine-forming)